MRYQSQPFNYLPNLFRTSSRVHDRNDIIIDIGTNTAQYAHGYNSHQRIARTSLQKIFNRKTFALSALFERIM